MADLVLKDYNGRDMPTYTGVKRVGIPDSNDNLVIFDDTSDATATAGDLAAGVVAYSQGQRLVGTGIPGVIGDLYLSIIGNSLSLSVTTPSWDGILEYSYDKENWTEWDGSLLLSENNIYLRGSDNTVITNGVAAGQFILNSPYKITISGNIETLLDYETVSVNTHPTMGSHAFEYLFKNCTMLVLGPTLRAMQLSAYCYTQMFYGCSNLIAMPELPASILTTHCYEKMFYGCTKLVSTTSLNALVLATYCYANMFEDCINLQQVTNLPATILQDYCYYQMFKNCVFLSALGIIYAQTLAAHSCEEMYRGCISILLSETESVTYNQTYRIPVTGIGTDATDALTNMFTDTQGSFTGTPNINTTYYWYCKYCEGVNPSYIEFKSINNTAITISIQANTSNIVKTWDGIIEYNHARTHGWIEWNGESITSNYIRLRGIGNTFLSGSQRSAFFKINGTSVQITGYLDSLLDYKAVINNTNTPLQDYGCEYLFANCTNITNTPIFRPNTMSMLCYGSMFAGCTSLTTATNLPAVNLNAGCYSSMFAACTSLTIAPELPAFIIAQNSYGNMFAGCTSLIAAPELPSTQISDYGYYRMFAGCQSLTTMPELPAMTLSTSCYELMFANCTLLTNVQELPAITLSERCYYGMFETCTSLTTMPTIQAATLAHQCCYRMFYGCTSLTTLTDFSAVNSAQYCYAYMFYGCTALSELPELAFHNGVANFACYYMFYGCSKIKLSSTQTGEYVTPYKLNPFGPSLTTGSNVFQSMFAATGGTFTGVPNITTTYYTANTIRKTKAYTEIGVHLTSELSIPLYFTPNNTRVIIDWGDNSIISDISASTTTTTHTYAEAGDYLIRIRGYVANWAAGRFLNNEYYSLFDKIGTETSGSIKTMIIPYVTSLQIGRDCMAMRYGQTDAPLIGNFTGLINIAGVIDVPGTINRLPNFAFANCTNVTQFNLHKGITYIDSGVFYNCSNLESFVCPKTITSLQIDTPGIGSAGLISALYGLFYNTKIRSFEIPANVSITASPGELGIQNSTTLLNVDIKSSINLSAATFQNCSNLANVVLNITQFNDRLLKSCHALRTITISAITTTIGDNVFDDCPLLQEIIVDPNNTAFMVKDNILYSKDQTRLIRCFGNQTAITIASNTTTISGGAFYHCQLLTSINLPNSITTIGDYAFYECIGLTSIDLPNSITTMGAYIFSGCTGLTSINLPNSITTIKNYSFQNCTSLSSIILSNNLTTMGSYIFQGCNQLVSLHLPATLNSIATTTFTGSAITQLTIDNNNNNYSVNANNLYDKNQTKLIHYTNQNNFTLPNSVNTIDAYAVAQTTLTNITIPASVTTINGYSFAYSQTLLEVTLPNSLTTLNSYAFYSDPNLTSITCLALTPPTLSTSSFYIPTTCTIYVPSSQVATYKAANGWSSVASQIQAIS